VTMRDVLLLRLDAPWMSFGAPIVDNHNKIQPYPALSMLTGLLGNALGLDHADAQGLSRLQARLRYASRQDRRGQRVEDFHTVDLGQDFLANDRAWTTRGYLDKRGGASSEGTHIRYREYWADALHTVALTLDPADEAPTLGELASAVQRPARPLFLGRKACLPAAPLFLGRVQAPDLLHALRHAPCVPLRGAGQGEAVEAWWSPDDLAADTAAPPSRELWVVDERDWRNQIHTGQRTLHHGRITLGGG
jgi:CRISPR system Cascade subunit CasD